MKVKLPSYFYTVPTKTGYHSIEYSTTQVHFIPLVNTTPATSRFTNDALAGKLDYVTWQGMLFRASVMSTYKEMMTEYLTSNGHSNVLAGLENTTIICLCEIPTLSKLAEVDYAFAQALEEDAPDTIIHSFIGDSRNPFNVNSLPNLVHVIAYKL